MYKRTDYPFHLSVYFMFKYVQSNIGPYGEILIDLLLRESNAHWFKPTSILGTPRCKIWVQSQHPKQGKHQKPHRNKLYQGRSRGGYSGR